MRATRGLGGTAAVDDADAVIFSASLCTMADSAGAGAGAETSPAPSGRRRITLVSVGSRGDVQPYVALGLALQAAATP